MAHAIIEVDLQKLYEEAYGEPIDYKVTMYTEMLGGNIPTYMFHTDHVTEFIDEDAIPLSWHKDMAYTYDPSKNAISFAGRSLYEIVILEAAQDTLQTITKYESVNNYTRYHYETFVRVSDERVQQWYEIYSCTEDERNAKKEGS